MKVRICGVAEHHISPVSDALIVVGCDDDIADAGAHADGNDLFVLGELLDPVFKDEPLPAV